MEEVWGYRSAVECLSCTHNALHSIHSAGGGGDGDFYYLGLACSLRISSPEEINIYAIRTLTQAAYVEVDRARNQVLQPTIR